jgi:hypothetical protein
VHAEERIRREEGGAIDAWSVLGRDAVNPAVSLVMTPRVRQFLYIFPMRPMFLLHTQIHFNFSNFRSDGQLRKQEDIIDGSLAT